VILFDANIWISGWGSEPLAVRNLIRATGGGINGAGQAALPVLRR
jgi:hypothetical protein